MSIEKKNSDVYLVLLVALFCPQAMFGANVCMWVGLILITGIDAAVLISDGPEPVPMYNPDTYVIFLGAVVVCFEGIGLVLPLRDSMEPHMQV